MGVPLGSSLTPSALWGEGWRHGEKWGGWVHLRVGSSQGVSHHSWLGCCDLSALSPAPHSAHSYRSLEDNCLLDPQTPLNLTHLKLQSPMRPRQPHWCALPPITLSGWRHLVFLPSELRDSGSGHTTWQEQAFRQKGQIRYRWHDTCLTMNGKGEAPYRADSSSDLLVRPVGIANIYRAPPTCQAPQNAVYMSSNLKGWLREVKQVVQGDRVGTRSNSMSLTRRAQPLGPQTPSSVSGPSPPSRCFHTRSDGPDTPVYRAFTGMPVKAIWCLEIQTCTYNHLAKTFFHFPIKNSLYHFRSKCQSLMISKINTVTSWRYSKYRDTANTEDTGHVLPAFLFNLLCI